jgi:single-stranded-DNA-specific exonuclease
MGHASEAIELLTTDDAKKAREIAEYLGKENDRRRRVEQEITAQAAEMVMDRGLDDPSNRAIVLGSDQWHGGVIGIVASRMVDRFGRPAVIMDIGEDGVTQGSARSIPGFHMAEALAACAEYLISHGGHAMAGGMRLTTSSIDDFSAHFVEYANQRIDNAQLLPSLDVEAETTIDSLSFPVVQALESMAPFGPHNPRPLVAMCNCRIVGSPRRMGQRGETISIMLQQGNTAIRCVGFRMGDVPDYIEGCTHVDVVGRPNINEFQGRRTVELELRDIRPSG